MCACVIIKSYSLIAIGMKFLIYHRFSPRARIPLDEKPIVNETYVRM